MWALPKFYLLSDQSFLLSHSLPHSFMDEVVLSVGILSFFQQGDIVHRTYHLMVNLPTVTVKKMEMNFWNVETLHKL